MNTINLKSKIVAVAIISLCAASYVMFALYNGSSLAQAKPTETVVTAMSTRTQGLPDFSAIVDKNGIAVVNISTSAHQRLNRNIPRLPQMDPEDPFYQFFRHFNIPTPQGDEPTNGLGSGFIINPDGVILTNAHVVAGADQITVKLTDRREFNAKLVGMDKTSDIAVLKIDAKNLPAVRIGDSLHIRVGEWVLAIGSPFGFENSATAGIVSAKSRSLPDEGYVPFIQTDVAINPGNSGGPLFDLNGDVVGINSQIYSQSGGYQGLSFAIPIDVAMKVEKKLEQHGHIDHGRLGVTIQEVNQALAESFGMKLPVGALVSSVEKGSAAEHAGIVSGDVILELNGKSIEHSNDLPPLVADLLPGSEANVTLWRSGGRHNVTVRVGKITVNEVVANSSEAGTGRLGLEVRPLSSTEKKEAGIDNGLIVQRSTGAAAKAGIQAGDIIVALNGTNISGIGQLKELVAKSNRHIALLILRGDSKIFVPIDLS